MFGTWDCQWLGGPGFSWVTSHAQMTPTPQSPVLKVRGSLGHTQAFGGQKGLSGQHTWFLVTSIFLTNFYHPPPHPLSESHFSHGKCQDCCS